jgi:hypothetical protein
VFPDPLGDSLTRLEQLQLWDNKLSGTLSPGLANLGLLRELWLQRNRISGALPPELLALPQLHVFVACVPSLRSIVRLFVRWFVRSFDCRSCIPFFSPCSTRKQTTRVRRRLDRSRRRGAGGARIAHAVCAERRGCHLDTEPQRRGERARGRRRRRSRRLRSSTAAGQRRPNSRATRC